MWRVRVWCLQEISLWKMIHGGKTQLKIILLYNIVAKLYNINVFFLFKFLENFHHRDMSTIYGNLYSFTEIYKKSYIVIIVVIKILLKKKKK